MQSQAPGRRNLGFHLQAEQVPRNQWFRWQQQHSTWATRKKSRNQFGFARSPGAEIDWRLKQTSSTQSAQTKWQHCCRCRWYHAKPEALVDLWNVNSCIPTNKTKKERNALIIAVSCLLWCLVALQKAIAIPCNLKFSFKVSYLFELAPDLLLCGPAWKQRWHHETQTQRCKAQSNHGTWPRWWLQAPRHRKPKTFYTVGGAWFALWRQTGHETWRCRVHARFTHGCAHKSSIVTPRNCQVPCCHRSQQQLKAPSTCNSPLVWNQKRWDQPMEPWQFRRCFGMIGSQSGNANKMLPSARNYPRIFCISTSKNNNQ